LTETRTPVVEVSLPSKFHQNERVQEQGRIYWRSCERGVGWFRKGIWGILGPAGPGHNLGRG